MRKLIAVAVMLAIAAPAFAQKKEQERLKEAEEVPDKPKDS